MKVRIVRERGSVNKRLNFEDMAEYEYRPAKCRKTYRMVVVRKNISQMKGELTLLDEVRYFFYITTRRDISAAGPGAPSSEPASRKHQFLLPTLLYTGFRSSMTSHRDWIGAHPTLKRSQPVRARWTPRLYRSCR